MPFCTNCGSEVTPGSKFCNNCGAAVNQPYKSAKDQRETVYEGNVYKCPHCGETLNSFVSICPACGYELRGKEATDSVKSFYNDLIKAQTTSQKTLLIRNFPIPNAKEDIVEFMILASSNILGEDEADIYAAWLAKFEQAYQKSLILFAGDSDFSRIQQIYNNCQVNIDTEKRRKIVKITKETVIRNIVVCIGLVLMVISVIMDRSGGYAAALGNSSLLESISGIILIASAASLFKRGASVIDYIVGAASGLLMMFLSSLMRFDSMGQMMGVIVLLIVAVKYIESLKKSKK